MRKFDFRLERLLRLRNHLERLGRIELLQEEGRLAEWVDGKEFLEQELSDTSQSLAPKRGARWKGREQGERVHYYERVESLLSATRQELEKQEEKVSESRKRLVERSRNKRTVEALKERQWETWRQKAEREELSELDEIGQRKREWGSQRGSVMVTALLLILTIGLGYLCFSTWNSWIRSGDVGQPILRAPFDRLAQNRVEEQLLTFQNDQRVRRQKLERQLLESRGEEGEVVTQTREREGFQRTLDRIRQKEEELRRKEDEIKSRQAALDQSQRDLQAEIRRNNNLLNRISSTLAELQELEERRNREISEDRKNRVEELAQMVRNQKPSDAATLLLAVAFPDPLNPQAPPFPPDESFEGPDLVMDVLLQVPSVNRAEIMNKMVRENAEQSALLFDMMDNPKTGLEEGGETTTP